MYLKLASDISSATWKPESSYAEEQKQKQFVLILPFLWRLQIVPLTGEVSICFNSSSYEMLRRRWHMCDVLQIYIQINIFTILFLKEVERNRLIWLW